MQGVQFWGAAHYATPLGCQNARRKIWKKPFRSFGEDQSHNLFSGNRDTVILAHARDLKFQTFLRLISVICQIQNGGKKRVCGIDGRTPLEDI